LLDFIKKSLEVKVLAVLTITVTIIMLVVIWIDVINENRQMLEEMNANSEEIASIIRSGLKFRMSIGDSGSVQKQLVDLKKDMEGIEIFICDSNQKITFSTHEDLRKSEIRSHIKNKNALQALSHALKTGEHPDEIFEEQVSGKRYLIHINPILNQKDCFQCHGSTEKVRGAIVVRKSTDRNYAVTSGHRNTNIFVSILGLSAIIALSSTLISRMIIRPVIGLGTEIRRLPEMISHESDIKVPDVKRTDEIGDLQDAFYQMATEIDEKTHAIEKSSMELASANKELEAFAYSVSHDLRAPLRNIDGFSKILLDEFSEKIDQKAQHYLKRIRDGTQTMSLLIDDMLTFSRMGRKELEMSPVHCNDIIKSVLKYYENEIKTRKISVHTDELPVIQCDLTLMQSLFSNLISNALKFTRNTEKPEITIGYDEEQKAIFVSENGVGFEMRYHDRIFQVFQRLHLPEEYEGTGIGLAIVSRIAERHHGSVWAESTTGKGATFYIKLPIFKEV
jgi:signal transduction histidine kinase